MPLSLRPPSLSDPLSLRDYTTRFCAFVRVYGDKSERGLRTNGLRGRQAATMPRATAASYPTGRPRPPTARPSASARIRFRPPLPLCRARRPFSALNRLPSLAPVPPSLSTGPHNGVALRGGNSKCFHFSMLPRATLLISCTNRNAYDSTSPLKIITWFPLSPPLLERRSLRRRSPSFHRRGRKEGVARGRGRKSRSLCARTISRQPSIAEQRGREREGELAGERDRRPQLPLKGRTV